MGEGGVPGAEVVDRYPHAQLPDGSQPSSGLLDVAHERRLGDLEGQCARIQPAFCEGVLAHR